MISAKEIDAGCGRRRKLFPSRKWSSAVTDTRSAPPFLLKGLPLSILGWVVSPPLFFWRFNFLLLVGRSPFFLLVGPPFLVRRSSPSSCLLERKEKRKRKKEKYKKTKEKEKKKKKQHRKKEKKEEKQTRKKNKRKDREKKKTREKTEGEKKKSYY